MPPATNHHQSTPPCPHQNKLGNLYPISFICLDENIVSSLSFSHIWISKCLIKLWREFEERQRLKRKRERKNQRQRGKLALWFQTYLSLFNQWQNLYSFLYKKLSSSLSLIVLSTLCLMKSMNKQNMQVTQQYNMSNSATRLNAYILHICFWCSFGVVVWCLSKN